MPIYATLDPLSIALPASKEESEKYNAPLWLDDIVYLPFQSSWSITDV